MQATQPIVHTKRIRIASIEIAARIASIEVAAEALYAACGEKMICSNVRGHNIKYLLLA